jgi:hypothetical protein
MHTPVIDTDIPLADFPPSFQDLSERVNAAFASLTELGHDIEVSDEDIEDARAVVTGAKPATETLLSSPGTIVHIKAILSEYDKAVVESGAQIRTFVTNKLLLETECPDPRIRMKALELLGKISDVGLFTEKTEITMRHRPTEELEQLLRERLTRVIEADPVAPPAYLDPERPMAVSLDDLDDDEPEQN